MKVLLIDNYDSFTYNLRDYLLQLGAQVQVERNDTLPLEAYYELPCDAVVFSPGPQRPKDAGLLLPLLDYFHNKKPILGICLGHQAIGTYFGASVTQAPVPVHGKTSPLFHNRHPLFESLPDEFEVMRYHSLIVTNIEETPLNDIAHTPDGIIMALTHQHLPITGVQFHPESILTAFGKELLANWLRLTLHSQALLIDANT